MGDTQATKHFDVLIIGGGPTGLTLGLCLLHQGKSVLIVDQHLRGLDFSRAILISTDTLSKLAPYGLNVALREQAVPVDGVSIFVNNRLVSSAYFDVSNADGCHPLCLPQLETEACLAQQFLARGGELMRGYTFNADSLGGVDGDFLTRLVSSADTAVDLSIHSTWLFGCDGFHSAVRQKMAIAYPGDSQPQPGYSLDVLLKDWPFTTGFNVWLSSEGCGLVIRLAHHKARIVATTRAACDTVLKRLTVEKILWETTFAMHYHVADSYGAGHLWLAGDAAHAHSPVGGRGMNMGIVDAVELAEAVRSGKFGAYASKRRSVAHVWVAQNRRITRVLMGQAWGARALRYGLFGALTLAGYVLGPRLAKLAFEKLSAAKLVMKT